MYKYLLLFFINLATIVQAQHLNVKISELSNPNEPSICIDPKRPNRLVAGANLNNVFVSSDTGKTWSVNQLNSPYGVWGDPCISVDTNGHFYFVHLSNPPNGSWIDRIVVQKTEDFGQTWSDGAFTGLNNKKAQDKHWIALDQKTNFLYMSWTEFDKYGSNNPQDSSRILFSKSIDGGLSWSNPLKINKVSGDCHDGDWTVEGAVPCVDVDGVLFVVWAGPLGLVLDYSKDGGNTWLQEDLKIGDFPGGWDYDIPGLSRCNGLPVTASDQSPGPYRGNWYLNWSDQRNGSNDTDVWVAKSTNKGLNWSAPVRVNTDGPGKQQFMSWMTVDPVTGWVWVVFYDRRAYSENSLRTDVYLAVSKDGGQNFSNFKISENDFSPNSSQFFGDYTNISAYNNIIRPIWTRQDGQNTSVWTALVDVHQIPLGLDKESGQIMENSEPNFPNPATDVVWVPFKIRRNTAVSMVVLDQAGRIVHTVFENKLYEYGKYTEMVDLKPLNLPNGNYYIQLRSAEKVLNQKLVLLGDK